MITTKNRNGNGTSETLTAKQPPLGKGTKKKRVVITAPTMEIVEFSLVGTAPYVTNAFSKKAAEMMHEKQAEGSTGGKGQKRDPKDFQALFEGSMHRDRKKGWVGMPATAFRNAAISACRLVGYKMTIAKLSLFVKADGYGEDGTPLVKLDGKPEYFETWARNSNGGCDLRARAKFDEWKARVRLEYDSDQFTLSDVSNLMLRIGIQVGIGEGRHDSPNSPGMGWGTFTILQK
jgi:hypothetical protein